MTKKQKVSPVRTVSFTYKKRHIQVLLDKVLFFRLVRNLHGRFWGLTGISVMLIGFTVCFLIRPDLVHISTAFSDFGTDIRTAPYFAGSVFFAAYGLWRWRNYLHRTWKRTMPVTGLITLTILGLYLVALMPVAWKPVPYYIHMFGVALAGASMLATVIIDGLLTKTRPNHYTAWWRLVRFVSFGLIVTGGALTAASAEPLQWYRISLLGESLLLAGYFLWIALKTYEGEGNRTVLSRILRKVIFID
jgi:multisubunit Na+/H+ antiporter MnhG subunit